MNIFGMGLPEIMVILTIALLVFGPKKLPEIGRSMGKAIRGFQDASREFESEIKREAEQIEASQPPKPPESQKVAVSEEEAISTSEQG
ncbi:TatA/E family twin arginine-targeting protein translocase [Phormidium pseudopriestleyi]